MDHAQRLELAQGQLSLASEASGLDRHSLPLKGAPLGLHRVLA